MRNARRLTTLLDTLGVLAGVLLVSAAPALAAAPEKPVTEAAKEVTATTATLHGVLNPNVSAKVRWSFAYSPEQDGHECVDVFRTPEAEVEGKALPQEKAVTELEPNKKYEFCLTATNEGGETRGNEVSFTTKPAPPKVDSESVSAVTPGEATLEAQVNPNNETTNYTFEYSTTKAAGELTGMIVNVSGGSTLKGFGDQSAGVSTGAVLAPSTTYYYRVIAENEQSKNEPKPAEGVVKEFTTVPSPFTGAVTEVTATGATFSGTLTPLSSANQEYYFDYKLLANRPECTGEGSTSPEDAGTGTGTKAVSTKTSEQAIELQPNATYSVCLVASNAFGSDTGQTASFTTNPAPPKIDSESTSLTPTIKLYAQINPNNEQTTYAFEYATKGTVGHGGALEGPVTKVLGATSLEAGFGDQTASISLESVVSPATTYYYRAVAENSQSRGEEKPVEGEVQSFTTPPRPLVTTGAAQSITQTAATLSGEVDPEGTETTYYFAYITEAGYREALKDGAANPYAGGESTPSTSAGSSTEPQAIPPTPIGGLQPGNVYYYALIATNAVGQQIGPPKTLTTLAGTPPVVTTGAVSNVSQNSATLSGMVSTSGLQTEYGFEISTTPGNYGPATGLAGIGGATTEAVSLTLGELQPGTTYYYRVTATSADGTTHGEPVSFTTPGFPTLLTPQTSPPLIASPAIAFPKEEPGSGTTTTPKALTNAQKLTAALKVCRKDKAKGKKAKCEKAARKKYPVAKAKKGRK